MRGSKYIVYIIISLLAVFYSSAIAEESLGFKLVVHSSNNINTLTKVQVFRVFMKKQTQWKNGDEILLIDQQEGTDVREEFTEKVFGKKGVVKSD